MPAPAAPELREILILLFAAGVVVPVVQRLRMSPVIGFLAVGVLLGHDSLAFLSSFWPWLGNALKLSDSGVHFLGELGVIFLLFTIGLELSLARLLAMRRLVFGLGGLQVTVSALAIGLLAAAFGNSLAASVIIGFALALSSTAIVVQLLAEHGRLGTTVGRASFAVLLLQDLAVVPILLLVTLLARRTEGAVALEVIKALAVATLAISLVLVLGKLFIRPFFRFVGATRSAEAFMAAALLTILGTAAATSLGGLSPALGAFLAGLIFSDTEYRHEIEVNIAPFKGLLLGIFFMSVGMGLSIRGLLADPFWVLASVLGLLVVKAVVLTALARLFGLTFPQAVECGLTLSQAGEFAFVIIGAALVGGLIAPAAGQFILVVAGLSMVLAPALARLAQAAGAYFAARAAAAGSEPSLAEPPATSLEGHVIIAGYGRVGRLIASLLNQQHLPHVALDLDPQIVAAARKVGAPVHYGSAARAGMLKNFNIAKASAVVITVGEPGVAESVTRSVRQAHPRIPIIARARDLEQANRLYRMGATVVVPEATEASLQLGEALLKGIGLPHEAARQLVDERRELERCANEEARGHGDRTKAVRVDAARFSGDRDEAGPKADEGPPSPRRAHGVDDGGKS